MKKILSRSTTFLTIYFLAMAGLANSILADDAGIATYTISAVKVTGNRIVSDAAILSKVQSREGQIFDQQRAGEDSKRLAQIEGVEYSYYSTIFDKNTVELTFVVTEKQPLRSIEFAGNKKMKDRTLRNKSGLTVGDYLDPVWAQAGRDAILEHYKKKGYAFAEVELDKEALSKGKAVYTITERSRVKIKAVKFQGNKAIKSGQLAQAVKTKKRGLLFLKGYYNELKVSGDVEKLLSIYDRQGYLNAAINADVRFSSNNDKATVIFDITEGPLYMIEDVTVSGNKFFTDTQLLEQIEPHSGMVYSELKAEHARKDIQGLCREQGFINAEVTKVRSFVGENKVSLRFTVNEGGQFRIGKVEITGNEQAHDKVIRRVLDEYDFTPGRWYNANIAQGNGEGELETDLRRTIYSESAIITPAGDAMDKRDALVNVIEGQTGSVMLGAGIGSDSGVVGQLVYEQRNFDLADEPENFHDFITGQAFKGAGQTLRISLQPGTEVSQYSVGFTEPYFQDKPVSMDIVGSSYWRGRESYDEQRTKGFLGFEKRYKSKWRNSIGFRAENVDVDSIGFDAPQEIKDVSGNNFLAGVQFGIGKDLTNNRFNPSDGQNYAASYEQVGGDFTFGILSATHRWYYTLGEDILERKTILATKLQASTIVGSAPPFEKFYAGGQGSLRGFEYRGISPRGLQTNVANPERKDPIGSDWLFLANAEITAPLVGESLQQLFFIDSGMVETGGYRAAVGTGIQILIPQWFGPVPMRFEFAFPIMKDEDDNTRVFSFSVGKLF
ncbi:MAG: outer membrane protein assembly factor BamA [Phycisphaerae bacterium]|nr:outer membrane protein assembly factor BamA [Phycisphaerae bacterium]